VATTTDWPALEPLGVLGAVNYSDAMAQWTLIDNIDGCPCCLANTKGVSTCAQVSLTARQAGAS